MTSSKSVIAPIYQLLPVLGDVQECFESPQISHTDPFRPQDRKSVNDPYSFQITLLKLFELPHIFHSLNLITFLPKLTSLKPTKILLPPTFPLPLILILFDLTFHVFARRIDLVLIEQYFVTFLCIEFDYDVLNFLTLGV